MPRKYAVVTNKNNQKKTIIESKNWGVRKLSENNLSG